MRDAKIKDEAAFLKALCTSCKRRLLKVLKVAALRNSTTYDFAACDECHDKAFAHVVVKDRPS